MSKQNTEGKNKKELRNKMLFFCNIVKVPSDVEVASSDDTPQLIEKETCASAAVAAATVDDSERVSAGRNHGD